MNRKPTIVAAVFGAALMMSAIAAATGPANAQPVIKLDTDSAKLVKLAGEPSAVVVSNPLYADATVQGRQLVLVGKSTGRTGVIVLDVDGNQIANFTVQVRRAEDRVVSVYKGGNRHTLHCDPFCDETLVVNDDQTKFDDRVKGLSGKFGLSLGASAPNGGGAQ